MNLYHHSINTILTNQAQSGAYIASPNFRTYAYSWFRDGSFIAHAMDRVAQHRSAAAFHRWAGEALRRYDGKIASLIERRKRGEAIELHEQMHTRFTLDGDESAAEWTNYQLDGYGTWLWALVDHLERTGDRNLYQQLSPQVERLVDYLAVFWNDPCYDCWEEFADKTHTATLCALYGGLSAIGRYDQRLSAASETAALIRAFVLEHCIFEGSLIKYIGSTAVDASLLGAAVPYNLFRVDDPVMQRTVERIDAELRVGGVRRYLADTYYGGGEWVLLAAWLGWYYAEAGKTEQALELLSWVNDQAAAEGDLPEQVNTNLLVPEQYEPWVGRWGAVASPLLWSHAMYLILLDVLVVPQARADESFVQPY
jgi:GH15 family glucan-1,4-alpha-glucosidase